MGLVFYILSCNYADCCFGHAGKLNMFGFWKPKKKLKTKKYIQQTLAGKPFRIFGIEQLRQIKEIAQTSNMIGGNVVFTLSDNLENIRHLCEQICENKDNDRALQEIIADLEKML